MIDESNQIPSILRQIAVSAAGAGLAWAMHLVLRRISPITTTTRLIWIAGLSILAGCLFALINSFAFYVLSLFTNELCVDGTVCTPAYLWLVAKEYSVNFLFVFAAWGLLYLWLESAAQTAAVERLASRAREQASRRGSPRSARFAIKLTRTSCSIA
ncbi:hypothetical protein [Sphingomonas sp. Leaf67]|uniref:hypothetical protein n=1 Tax=Sphingomonas sp. Leaf67 TaxID=1736230 RepID=UPI0006F2EF23|nr:hypothetical protein [Sphingomonas sp. Leaf67]